jgi:3-isopropylmalate dehydrogenase
MNKVRVLSVPGDGIGPEVTVQAVAVLRHVCERAGVSLEIDEAPFGGASIDLFGVPVTEETLEKAKAADAVLLGAVGGPKWDHLPSEQRAEKGLLNLRAALEVYANLRPAKLFPALESACPLKPERARGMDFVVVRELIGGIYFGQPRGVVQVEGATHGVTKGFNTASYTDDEVRRIGKAAFEVARTRKKKLMSVDKANVLEVSALWRKVMTELGASYPDVQLSHMYVDNAAMQLILNPRQFDVIVTSNLFGDILSDEAGALTGSIGMLPSASLGDRHALYEPVHGSAPDIAGLGKANPLAAILSVAMLVHHTLKRPEWAQKIEAAVDRVLASGLRTADIASADAGGAQRIVTTSQMGAAVLEQLSS